MEAYFRLIVEWFVEIGYSMYTLFHKSVHQRGFKANMSWVADACDKAYSLNDLVSMAELVGFSAVC